MAGTKQNKLSGDPQRQQMTQQHTLQTSIFSATVICWSLLKERVCLDGCEVTTATVACCVASFCWEMALLLPRQEGGNSLPPSRLVFSISMSQLASGLPLRIFSDIFLIYALAEKDCCDRRVFFRHKWGPECNIPLFIWTFGNAFTPWIADFKASTSLHSVLPGTRMRKRR